MQKPPAEVRCDRPAKAQVDKEATLECKARGIESKDDLTISVIGSCQAPKEVTYANGDLNIVFNAESSDMICTVVIKEGQREAAK